MSATSPNGRDKRSRLRLAWMLALPIRHGCWLWAWYVTYAKTYRSGAICYAQAGGRWIVRPLGNATTSGSWHFAGRSRGMFL